jgi:hypothetical protein
MIATFVLNTRSSRYYRFKPAVAPEPGIVVISYNGFGKGHWRETVQVYFAAVHVATRGRGDAAAERSP